MYVAAHMLMFHYTVACLYTEQWDCGGSWQLTQQQISTLHIKPWAPCKSKIELYQLQYPITQSVMEDSTSDSMMKDQSCFRIKICDLMTSCKNYDLTDKTQCMDGSYT